MEGSYTTSASAFLKLTTMKNFATRLKELRKKMNLSQQQLAIKTGIKRGAIMSYESGRATPPIEKLLLFKKAFKCSIEELTD